MTNTPPHWQAHTAPGYEVKMASRCASLEADIVANPSRRHAILSNPRGLHAELFSDFAPLGFPEYAGTYRGAAGTTLFGRRAFAESQQHRGSVYEFVAPNEVAARMHVMLANARDFVGQRSSNDYDRLLGLAYAFCWFGKIHPFLDGNGHVQRALFATIATEFGIPLSSRFAIHPRPYDRLLAMALELFTRAPQDDGMGELPLAAEYLAFFLAGAYNAPRKNLSTASLQ
jgi:hypothetical protein